MNKVISEWLKDSLDSTTCRAFGSKYEQANVEKPKYKEVYLGWGANQVCKVIKELSEVQTQENFHELFKCTYSSLEKHWFNVFGWKKEVVIRGINSDIVKMISLFFKFLLLEPTLSSDARENLIKYGMPPIDSKLLNLLKHQMIMFPAHFSKMIKNPKYDLRKTENGLSMNFIGGFDFNEYFEFIDIIRNASKALIYKCDLSSSLDKKKLDSWGGSALFFDLFMFNKLMSNKEKGDDWYKMFNGVLNIDSL